jgi:hypothetical protein
MLKVQLNAKVEGCAKLNKTQRMIVLLCAVIKVTSYSFYIFSSLIKLPYYVLQTYYNYVCETALLKLFG